MSKQTIRVTIIEDSSREECQAGCGVDWSSPEAIALAGQRIKDRFGDRIQLEYLDLSQAAASQDVSQWNEIIKIKNLSPPLLLINSQPRIAGQFDIRQLLDAIEAEMEIRVQWR